MIFSYRIAALAISGFLSCSAIASETDLTTQYGKFFPLKRSCTTIIDSIAMAHAQIHKSPRVYEFKLKARPKACQDVYFTKKAPATYVLYKLVYDHTINNVRIRVFKAISLARLGVSAFVWDIAKVEPEAKPPTNSERTEFGNFLAKFNK